MTSRIEDIITEIHSDSRLAGVSWGIGRRYLEETSDFPRIAWVLNGGPIQAPTRVGARLSTGGDSRDRTIAIQAVDCDVFVWGGDLEQTEKMLHALLAVAHSYAVGSLRWGNHRWETHTQRGADHMARGELAVVTIGFDLPILAGSTALSADAPDTLTNITSHDHTGTVNWLDGSSSDHC